MRQPLWLKKSWTEMTRFTTGLKCVASTSTHIQPDRECKRQVNNTWLESYRVQQKSRCRLPCALELKLQGTKRKKQKKGEGRKRKIHHWIAKQVDLNVTCLLYPEAAKKLKTGILLPESTYLTRGSPRWLCSWLLKPKILDVVNARRTHRVIGTA